MEQNLLDTIARISGVNPRKCMRCGKCTASCPAFEEMDYHPHQFVSMVENGRIDELLRSRGIYLCLLRVFQCLFLVYHAFHSPASANRSALSKFVFCFRRSKKEARRAPFVSVYQIVSSNGEASTSLSAGTASAAPGLVTAIALATVACRSVSRMERFCTMPRTK